MAETPKRTNSFQSRYKQEFSPTPAYDCDNETTEVTYEFLPKSKLKEIAVNVQTCKLPLGKRPHKFIKSPNMVAPNNRLLRIRKITNDENDGTEHLRNLIKDMIRSQNVEKENTKNTPVKTKKSPSCNDIDYCSSLLNDSSSDLMVHMSNIEEMEKASQSQRTTRSRSASLSEQKENTKSTPVQTKKSTSCNDIDYFSSLLNDSSSDLMVHMSNIEEMEKASQSQRTTRSRPASLSENVLSQLLDDGNDDNLIAVDESTCTQYLNSPVSCRSLSKRKCTPQEIEAKRKLAIKKLQEKCLKSYNFRNRKTV